MKNFLRVLGLALLAAVCVQIVWAQPNASQSGADITRLVLKGRALSADEAANLEKTLAADPKNFAARVTLLGYYSTRHDDDFKAKKAAEALWFIRNMPDSPDLRWLVQVRLDPILDKEYPEAKQMWLENLDGRARDGAQVSGRVRQFLEGQ